MRGPSKFATPSCPTSVEREPDRRLHPVSLLLNLGATPKDLLIPLVVAFARVYGRPWAFYPAVLANLALLLTIPVSAASIIIIALVRASPGRGRTQ